MVGFISVLPAFLLGLYSGSCCCSPNISTQNFKYPFPVFFHFMCDVVQRINAAQIDSGGLIAQMLNGVFEPLGDVSSFGQLRCFFRRCRPTTGNRDLPN